MSATTGQAIVAILESDVLTAFGGPLLDLLGAVKANPNPLAEAAAWVKFQGAIVGALPGLEQVVIGQLVTALTAKVQAALLKAGAPAV